MFSHINFSFHYVCYIWKPACYEFLLGFYVFLHFLFYFRCEFFVPSYWARLVIKCLNGVHVAFRQIWFPLEELVTPRAQTLSDTEVGPRWSENGRLI